MLGVSLSSQEEGIRGIRATQTSAPHYQLRGLDQSCSFSCGIWGGIEVGVNDSKGGNLYFVLGVLFSNVM